ncbi:MAG: undecaprenyldiphospho-muramoylpentapeptide beta-N-acetylglucosaminyltransferase [Bacteroidales bacterium]|nr:undecaprenyldiphospho-muramoylpentapeptide beta-N-acetylglucosaminyltransferase [Bacteroidales bacterium]MDE6516172.1 undecaprenyldiphospho-muramoylpentapeptide beta-N-acetylglucosaminyltransferase [Bacteroidales bacterium]MDE7103540.1 undecaprenyldiphospho-muramoylpentapeptide beta-N-acetylglucosaminyltransferase [Bacteroidales bacterium]
MQEAMKVIVSGGGTGGHVFPAIAIANAIKAERPDTEILFVGAKGRMEMDKVPAAGYRIEGLNVIGLNRKQWWKNLTLPFKLISSLWHVRKLIKQFAPDVVVGVGGYASGPTLYVAGLMGIPYLIQEQNSFPGLTNRMLAKRARKICVDYEDMEQFFPKERILMTGNPIRQDIVDLAGKRAVAFDHFGLNPDKPVLLVIGGSLGARSINRAMLNNVDAILASGCQILWQTGGHYYEQVKAMLQEEKPGLLVKDFIKNMDLAYAMADVVVSRAGAIAISELCVVGKPVILVPSPNVAEDHQTKNALALSARNAAILMPDDRVYGELGKTVVELMQNERRKTLMSENISRMGKTTSAQDIAKWVFRIAEEDAIARFGR